MGSRKTLVVQTQGLNDWALLEEETMREKQEVIKKETGALFSF